MLRNRKADIQNCISTTKISMMRRKRMIRPLQRFSCSDKKFDLENNAKWLAFVLPDEFQHPRESAIDTQHGVS